MMSRNAVLGLHRVRPLGFSWESLAFAAAALVLFVLPMARLLLLSLQTGDGAWTLDQYAALLADRRAYAAIGNTLYISLAASAISAAGGVVTAFLVGYTNIRYKHVIEILVFLPFVIPAYVITLSWTGLTASSGALTLVLARLGLAPLDLYSVGGIIAMLGICHMSVVYATVIHTLRKLPLETGWAARASGCPVWRSLLRIDLPMVMPAVAGGTVLAFLADIDNFAVPAFLGISADIPVLSTYIYERIISFGPSSFTYGAVLSVVLALIALAASVLSVLLGRRQRVLESSREDLSVRVALAPAVRRTVELSSVVLLTLFSIVPCLYMAVSALLKGFVFSLDPAAMTLDNYRFAFTNEGIRDAALNSLFMAGTATVICLLAGTLIAYVLVRRKSRTALFLNQCAAMTYSVPGIVLALALIFYWNQPVPGLTTGLYGTYTIIIIGYVTRYMILQIKNSAAAFLYVAEASEQAARVAGSTWWRLWRRIILPQLLAPALSGAFFIFLSSLTELTMSSVMSSASTKTIGLAIFNLQQAGDYSLAAAVSAVIIFFVAAVFAVQKLIRSWHAERSERLS